MTATRTVITLGETMGLLHSETPGRLEHASRMLVGIGGSESNVAIGLARLGTPSTWVGRVGDDSLGRRIVRELRAEGVCVRSAIDADAPTGLMLKERQAPGMARVWYYRSGSAGSRLSPADIPSREIADAALLHLTGITPALSPSAHDAVLEAARVARSARVPISFDVNHRPSLWREQDPAPLYRRLAAMADIVFASEDEARLLAPTVGDIADLARDIAILGPRQVIITLGADGCFARIEDLEFDEAAVPVRVVDSVGAGDAFVAGYLAELLAGAGARTRLRTAVTAGAFACLSAGDWEGLPRREDLALLTADEPVTR